MGRFGDGEITHPKRHRSTFTPQSSRSATRHHRLSAPLWPQTPRRGRSLFSAPPTFCFIVPSHYSPYLSPYTLASGASSVCFSTFPTRIPGQRSLSILAWHLAHLLIYGLRLTVLTVLYPSIYWLMEDQSCMVLGAPFDKLLFGMTSGFPASQFTLPRGILRSMRAV